MNTSSEQPITATRLNGDTTWLLRLPVTGTRGGYNLLIDPWLASTAQTDYYQWFSSQTRIVDAQYASLKELGSALAEGLATARVQGGVDTGQEIPPRIDGILLSHPFTDHMHPESLLAYHDESRQLDVFCTPQSHAAFQRLLGDDKSKQSYNLHIVSDAPRDLPPDVAASDVMRIHRLPAQESAWTHGPAWADLHSGILIQIGTSAIVYSPHGTLASSLPCWLTRETFPTSRTLITCFDEQIVPLIRFFTGPVALGLQKAAVEGWLQTYAPTHILRTHDERKTAKGLIGKIISRKAIDGEQAAKNHIAAHAKAPFQGQIIDARVGQVVSLADDAS